MQGGAPASFRPEEVGEARLHKKGGVDVKLVDKNSEQPLYLQLADIIIGMIDSGELPDGSFLMPEREIGKLQDLSRMTVNKAIMKLVAEGRLSRHQGKGTIVTAQKEATRFERLDSLSEIMAKKGIAVKNDLLSFETVEATPTIAKRLELTGDKVIKIVRRRYFGEEPVLLETMYLNPALVPGLTLELVVAHSMYTLFQHNYGHRLTRAEQIIRPFQLTKKIAQILKQPPGMLALQIDRVAYTDKEEPMEYTQTVFLTHKHDFEVVFNR